MKTAIFDLETFSLHANTGIILCAVIKTYDSDEPATVIRADKLPGWKNRRSDCRPICAAIIKAMEDYDIFVAHNGMRFDRKMLVSFALRYKLRLFLRLAKFIDPCDLSRRQLRLTSNSLATVADFLGVEQKKTDIDWDDWRKAAYEGSSVAMNRIVEHCIVDVDVLEKVHRTMRKIVKDVNERGSSF